MASLALLATLIFLRETLSERKRREKGERQACSFYFFGGMEKMEENWLLKKYSLRIFFRLLLCLSVACVPSFLEVFIVIIIMSELDLRMMINKDMSEDDNFSVSLYFFPPTILCLTHETKNVETTSKKIKP